MENLAGRLFRQISTLRKEVKSIRQVLLEEKKLCYNNREVMDLFGVSTQVLKSWRDAGLIGYSMIGRFYYYTREDILKLLEETHFDAFIPERGTGKMPQTMKRKSNGKRKTYHE